MESDLKARVFRLGGATIAAAMLVAVPFVADREGGSLQAYRDVVGVWTICNGETSGVKAGQSKTQKECDALTNSRVGQFMTSVANMITVPLQPQTLAAHTSFAYNIGIAGYARSTALRETNEGNLAAGCNAMMIWNKAGGKDCRVKSNGCYGLIQRRVEEVKLCMAGVVQ